ncbi:MAG: hypothetical protein RMI91_00185 [Gemmatales bacterium]|nr:hypothetical protein [Gemmatales bacterium]
MIVHTLASLVSEGISWAILDTDGNRRVIRVSQITATRPPEMLPTSAYSPMVTQDDLSVTAGVDAGFEYRALVPPQAPGWQLIDRLSAEVRWLQRASSSPKYRLRLARS